MVVDVSDNKTQTNPFSCIFQTISLLSGLSVYVLIMLQIVRDEYIYVILWLITVLKSILWWVIGDIEKGGKNMD